MPNTSSHSIFAHRRVKDSGVSDLEKEPWRFEAPACCRRVTRQSAKHKPCDNSRKAVSAGPQGAALHAVADISRSGL